MVDRDSTPAAQVRGLLRRSATGVLATLLQPRGEGESALAGWPYASLVLLAAAMDGAPLLLLSDLAQHTANARADGRVSLSIAGATAPETALSDPLAAPRASLLGRLAPAADPALAARFLARHPAARDYAGFADFRFWRMEVERVHLVAGFGRIAWADGVEFRHGGETAALAEAEAGILAHMNADHADAVALYATRLCGQAPGDWRMTGCDPEGIDLQAGDGRRARLDFDAPVSDAAGAHAALVALARRARQTSG